MSELKKINPAESKTMAAVVVACAALLYADYAFIMKPQFAGIKKVQQETAAVRKDLAAFEQESRQTTALQKTYNQKNRLNKAKSLVSEDQVLTLLERISSLAKSNQVVVGQIQPVRSSQPAVQVAAGQAPMTVYSVDLELTSGYHNLGYFLDALENDDIFMAVQSMRLVPAGPDQVKQKVQLTVRTYLTK